MSKTVFALAAAAIIGGATFASAQMTNSTGNYFGQSMTMDASSVFEIALVTASGDGTVGVYDFGDGSQGELLGEIPVKAGANADIKINLGVRPLNDVIVVLMVGGMVTATQEYEITN